MRTKRTIRRMTPMARKAAHITRSAGSIVKRLEYLTEELQRLEMTAHAMGRELAECKAERDHMRATWIPGIRRMTTDDDLSCLDLGIDPEIDEPGVDCG